MELKIGNRTYELNFGIRFIRELDRIYTIDPGNGVQFGLGINSAAFYLEQRNPVILFDIIKAATITEKPRPSEHEIEQFLDQEKDLEKLFQDFLEQLENAPMTAPAMRRTKEVAEGIENEEIKAI